MNTGKDKYVYHNLPLSDVITGDFRQNLMVVREATCNGGAAQQWDFITAGLHNDRPGTTLIVSSSIVRISVPTLLTGSHVVLLRIHASTSTIAVLRVTKF